MNGKGHDDEAARPRVAAVLGGASAHPPEAAPAWRLPYTASFVTVSAIAVFFRVRPIRYSLWHDEAHTLLTFVQQGPGEIVASPNYDLGNHILTNLLVWVLATPLGYAEWVLRSPSTLAGLAALGLLVWFTYRNVGRAAALVVVVLSAVSVEQADLVPQVRGYGVAYLSAVGLLVLGHALVQRWTAPRLAGYCATMFLGIYNYPALALLAVATTLLLVPVVRHRIWLLGAAAATAALTVAVYLPVVRVLYGDYDSGFEGGIDVLDRQNVAALPIEKVSGLSIETVLFDPAAMALPMPVPVALAVALAAMVALIAGLVVVVREDRALALLLAGAPLLALLLGYATSAPMGTARYTSFLGQHMLLLAALGIVGLWRAMVPRGLADAGRHRDRSALLGAVLVGAILVAVTVPNAVLVNQKSGLPKENFKQALREAAVLAEDEDVLLVINSRRPTGFLFYVARDLPPAVDLRVTEGPDATCEALRTAGTDRDIVLLEHLLYNDAVIASRRSEVTTTRPPQDGRGFILVHGFDAEAIVEPGRDGVCG